MSFRNIYWLMRNYFSSRPIYLIQFVTARCNSRCNMCFYWKNIDAAAKEKELTLEEMKKIAKNFPGLQQLSIGGGEPFLREDLPEICEIFSRTCNAQTITIPTNGLLPEKICSQFEKILQKCPKSYFRLSLSIDDIGEKHDKIRGVKGNFEKALETYKKIRSLKKQYKNFNIDVATVLSSYNQDHIKDVFEYVEKNMDADNHFILLARGNTREKAAKEVQLEKYEELLRWLASRGSRKENRPFSSILRAIYEISTEIIIRTEREKRMLLPCVAGRKMLIISEYGDVYPCEINNLKFGNMRNANFSLDKILNSGNTRAAINKIRKGACPCTFECAINASIVFNPRTYPSILARIIKRKIWP